MLFIDMIRGMLTRSMCKLESVIGGGGLVALSCLTLATPWTIAC